MTQSKVKTNKEKSLNKPSDDLSNQDPQGILKHDKSLNQDPPGMLKGRNPVLISSTKHCLIKIEDIVPYKGIGDYLEPKPSSCPNVIVTPSNCYCVDGQDLIDRAIEKEQTVIMCQVIEMDAEYELEIAIRKATIRTVSDEGKPLFAEMVRNCRAIYFLLLQTIDNPVFYSHGGKRKGIHYDSNRQNNVRVLLAERFDKSISTINQYLNYSEYLNEDTIDSIVQSKVGKKFFEAAASNKRRLIKILRSEKKDDRHITEKVSSYMACWLEEWCEGGKKKITPMEFKRETPPAKSRCQINLPTTFEHHGEIENHEEELSEQQIRQEIQNQGLSIYTNLNDEKFGTDDTIEKFKSDITQALVLIKKLTSIKAVA